MKLYATVTSERDSRPAKKGGDEYIAVELTAGNSRPMQIFLRILDKGEPYEGWELLYGDMQIDSCITPRKAKT